MNNKTLITLVAQREILTKFNIDNDEFSIFTIFDPYIKNEFKSLIKIASKNRALWTVKATNTSDAAINHIALVNMVHTHSIFRWNDKVFAEQQHSVRTKFLEKTPANQRCAKKTPTFPVLHDRYLNCIALTRHTMVSIGIQFREMLNTSFPLLFLVCCTFYAATSGS